MVNEFIKLFNTLREKFGTHITYSWIAIEKLFLNREKSATCVTHGCKALVKLLLKVINLKKKKYIECDSKQCDSNLPGL